MSSNDARSVTTITHGRRDGSKGRNQVSISLTRAQWRYLLLAADNGAMSGDPELLENMLPHKAARRRFLEAVKTISERIGANYDTDGYL